MFKKLLVVVLALTFLVSLCSMALATKDPSEFKRGTNVVGTPGAGRLLYNPQPLYPPTGSFTGISHYVPNPQPLQRPAAPCGIQSQYNSVDYLWIDPGLGTAVRWSTAADACTLKTVSLALYASGTYPFVGTGGLTGYVWSDNGSGLPGAVIYSVNIPHASVMIYPTMTNFNPNVIIPASTTYHTGFMTNVVTDVYNPLSDDTPTSTSSSAYLSGSWSGNGVPIGGRYWVQEIQTCCETPAGPVDCGTQLWHCGPVYRWPGGFTPAQRFTSTGPCTLKTFRFFISSSGIAGYTGGVNVRVYADAGGLPGAVLGSVFVPHASIVPSGVTSVNLAPLSLVFAANQDYHVGYVRVNPVEDYQPVGDDGELVPSCPDAGVLRGSASFDGGLSWDYMANIDIGYDDNWIMEVDYCCAPVVNACENYNYAGSPFYYWPEPDAYGDTFRNQRFTNASYCSLKTVNLGFEASGSVGTPGAEVYIWNSDGTYPTSVITTYIINPVTAYFPSFTSINVAPANIIISGDFHVGYTTIQNAPTDVLAILSDNGASGSGRSGEFYLGNWWLMANSWGVDVDFLINVDVCCLPPGYCPITCSPTDQWPTFSHDYSRTGQSQMYLGDLCGIVSAWRFVGTGASNFSTPVISNDLVVCAHDDRIQAVNLLTGLLVWDTKAGALAAQYALAINTGLRSQLTIDGGSLYFGTGGLRGFVKADLLTGNLIWARGIGVANPLPGVPGLVTYGGSIVRGNEVYFGDSNGQLYALNATTGANLYFAQILTSNLLKGAITGAPSTDGSQLFIANAANLTSATTGIGGVRSISPGGSFTQNWVFESPNIPVLHEAFAAAPAFRCTNLFIHASFSNAVPASGFSGYRQNLDPATGIPNWAQYFLIGQNAFGGNTAVDGSQAYFASLNNGFSGPSGSRGVRAVNFANSTVWARGGTAGAYDENVFQSVAVTCDPYLVYATYDLLNTDAHWRIVDGMTGVALVDYYLTAGMPNGTAIAMGSDSQVYLVFSTRFTNHSAGPGGLFAFKNGGPRPRMSIPELVVAFTGTNTSESSPVQRTDVDAVENVGCATLNVTATLEAGNPPSASRRISDVNPSLAVKAQSLASSLIDYSIYDVVERVSDKGLSGAAELMDADGEIISQAAVLRDVKPSRANSEALAPPTWVDWVAPFSGGATVNFGVAAGLSQNFTFEFDRSGMNFLAPNNFYVYIDSDDPDYNLEAPLASPQAIIEYQIPYEYCPKDTGRMEFGTTGGEWYTNFGRLADGLVTFEFTLDGSTDGTITYSGGMWFMTSMDDAAWNPDASSVPAGFGFLFPFYVGPFANGDCGGCDFGVTLPVEYTTNNGATYANTVGDLCTFAMIDSLQAAGLWPHQAGPSIGLLINYREVGTYGADFGDFKLIVVDMNNRNAAAVNGLYYGNIEDFDPIDVGYGDPAKGYVYQSDGAGKVRGFIGLPLNGSYWPDGSKTDPMYNARTIENGEVVYPSAACPECILDSLFAFVDGLPEGAYDLMADGALGPDKSTIAAFGKVDLAPNGSHSYGFAIYGFNTVTVSQNDDTEALSKFVNKYAGFARGDVNNDDLIDLRDLVRLSRYVAALPGALGPAPFKHLGDVDNDGDVDSADCSYLAAYYFTGGAPPKSAFKF